MQNLYYTNASGDQTWENLSNWNTAADGSGDNPTNIPWTDDGNGGAWYGDADLYYPSQGYFIVINSANIDPNKAVTGNCYAYITIYGNGTGMISGGNYYADVENNVIITGGNFFGGGWNYASITGGRFYYSSYPFYNWGGNISGVEIDINSFENKIQGTIDYPSIRINYNGVPYTGEWYGQIWNNGEWVSLVTKLYYTNASGDQTWENLSNWNTAADGSGYNASNIPWTDDGNGFYDAPSYGVWYGDADLIDASGGAGVYIYSNIGTINAVITGSCGLLHLTNRGILNGGTFILPAISVTTSGGNTYLSMDGGPTFAYPTPSSGGGGNNSTISRLLNLPWFINI